jgi:hypothetical protein
MMQEKHGNLSVSPTTLSHMPQSFNIVERRRASVVPSFCILRSIPVIIIVVVSSAFLRLIYDPIHHLTQFTFRSCNSTNQRAEEAAVCELILRYLS